MSIQPRLESRVLAQEQMQVTMNAFVVELAEDMTTAIQRVEDDQLQNSRKIDALSQDLTAASFEQLVSYQKQTERKIDERFGKIEEDIAEIKEDLAAVKEDLAAVKETMATKEDLAAVKAVMATKEDLAAVKGDMQVMARRMDQRMLALEGRMEFRMDALDQRVQESFKQVLAMMNTRLPPAQ
jgi:hypothetical protein